MNEKYQHRGQNMNVICVIPARGGSKGIPRKNIRFLLNKPLISYVIEAAKKCRYINYIVVSTDDELISYVAHFHKVHVIKRPKRLSQNHIPIDPVVYHTVNLLEKRKNVKFDVVVTLQPTCPLIDPETIDAAIATLIRDKLDTVVPLVDATHLYWIKKDNDIIPFQNKRANRQLLRPIYKESGAFLVSKRTAISPMSRFGKKLGFVILSKIEGLDIDDYSDWWMAESSLRKIKIAIITDGDFNLGMGHVYRMLSLANKFIGHEIMFFMSKSRQMGIEKVKQCLYNVKTYNKLQELLELIEKYNPQIVINDILDTEEDYILKLKERDFIIVNFEDLGKGAQYADLVINALYENSNPPPNHFYGYRYVILRDEFRLWPVKKRIKKNVSRLLLCFGGVDQNNLTLRSLKAIEQLNMKNIRYSVIVGPGYQYLQKLLSEIKQLKKQGFKVSLYTDVPLMIKHIYDADVMMTSNGRTLYEAACVCTPCISISQNEREMLHLFSKINYGIMNLGLASNLSIDIIKEQLKELISNDQERRKMHKALLKYAPDIRKGIFRVKKLIERTVYGDDC